MHHFFLLAKRRFQQTLSEPGINYAYKAAGFLAMVGFLAVGIVSVLFPPLTVLPTDVMFVLSAFGAIVFFAGLASSEAWLLAMRRRYDYAMSFGPYSRIRLGLFVLGLLSVTLLIVYLIIL